MFAWRHFGGGGGGGEGLATSLQKMEVWQRDNYDLCYFFFQRVNLLSVSVSVECTLRMGHQFPSSLVLGYMFRMMITMKYSI